MTILSANELKTVEAGAAVTATMLNAVSRLISTVLLLGQIVGSAIKLSKSNYSC